MGKLFDPALKLDWRIAVLTVVSTTLLIVNAYHAFTPWIYVDRVILYLFRPTGSHPAGVPRVAG